MPSVHEPVLIVEDERAQREAMMDHLRRAGHPVEGVATGRDALEALARRPFAAVITDLRLPDLSGLEVIRRAHELDEELGLMLVTAYATVDSAVEALRLGAHDYLLKPLMLDEVETRLANLLRTRDLLRDNARLRQALGVQRDDAELVADSPAMRDVVAWIRRAAAVRANLLITGETGAGKEVVARAVHRLGPTAAQPFQAINVASIPDSVLESELFGHEKGAFTGADRRREGLLRAAGDGTVLLDEVAELSPALQAKLLRALEDHQVRPVGSDVSVPFQARLIAATNRDLQAFIADGRFREDLFFRLNVMAIHVPPLRERREDLPRLVRDLVTRHAHRMGLAVPVIAADVLRALASHPWRGNVRELSNLMERALIQADDGRIDLTHLPAEVQASTGQGLSLADATARFERAHIRLALELCDGNRERTAKELGVSPATLYRKLNELGVRDSESRDTR